MYRVVLVLLLAITTVHSYEDATAYIDHLFVYPVSLNKNMKIVESGSETLPAWLHYDKSSQVLKGVPSTKDQGTSVLVVHNGSEDDMFAITVVQNPQSTVAQSSSSTSTVPTICMPNEAVTVVNVLLQANLDDLTTSLKSSIIEGLSKHLSMQPNHMVLKRSTNEQNDASALVRGSGDSDGEAKSVLSWVAGCGAVKSQQMEQLEQLESSARDGSLGRAVGQGITGWQVTSNTLKTKRRLKRAVLTATPTPAVTPGPEETTTKMTADTVTPTATPQESSFPHTTPASSPTPQITPPTSPLSATSSTTSSSSTYTTPFVNPKPTTSFKGMTSITSPTTAITAITPTTAKPTSSTPHPPSTPPPVTTPPPPRNSKPKFPDNPTPVIIPDVHLGRLLQHSLASVLNSVTDEDGDDIELTVEPYFGNQANPWYRFDADSSMLYALPVQDNTIGTHTFVIRAKDSRGGVSATELMLSINVIEPRREDTKQWYTISFKDQTVTSDLVIELIRSGGVLGNISPDVKSFDGTTITFATVPSTCTSDILNNLRAEVTLDIGETYGMLEVDMVTVEVIGCPDVPPELNQDKFDEILSGVTVEPGVLFTLELPRDLFYDKLRLEDFDLRNLHINLLLNGRPSSDLTWLTYDPEDQSLKGLALIDEYNTVENTQYTLEAIDKKGQASVGGEFRLTVSPIDIVSTNSFVVTFEADYAKFINNRPSQIKMYERMKEAFKSIILVNKFSLGSVKAEVELLPEYSSPGCPVSIQQSRDYVFNKDNKVRPDFVEALRPFETKRVEFTPKGSCEGTMEPISAEVTVPGPVTEPNNRTTLIIVVIVVVIVVIIIVVCVVFFCVKRKRRGEHDVSSDNNQIIEKGVPVVFDEELKDMDKREPTENEPLMTEDKPKPPAYPNGKNANRTALQAGESEDYQPPTPPSEPEELSP